MKNKKLFCFYLPLPFFLFFNIVSGQVPVREEPRHKVVLENDYVRLLDVHIPSGDTTLYHIHAAPSVIVFISKSTTGSQLKGEKPSAAGEVLPGDTRFVEYDEKPITHRVWNQSSSTFHVMDIELVKKNISKDTCQMISGNDVQLQWQQKSVSTYRINIKQGREVELPKSNCAYLLIDITGKITTASGGNIHQLKEGGYVFAQPQTEIKINSSNSNAECVLLELK
jgi:hypothetical protein